MDMVLSLTETVGLVHQIPFVSDREGFSGVLEKVCHNYSGKCSAFRQASYCLSWFN